MKPLAEIVEDAAGTLDKLHHRITTSSYDFGQHPDDARLYAVLVGLECEQDHQHDPEQITCAGSVPLLTAAMRFGWTTDQVRAIQAERASIRALIAAADRPTPPVSLTEHRPAVAVEFRAAR